MRLRLGSRSAALAAATAFLMTGAATTATATASTATGVDPDAAAPTITWTTCPDGSSVGDVHHAPGFNPLTATDAQLTANNLPPRPTAAAAMATWTHYVTTATYNTACPQPDTSPVRNGAADKGARTAAAPDTGAEYNQHSANWAGNVANGDAYADADGTFTVALPQAPAGPCANAFQWAYSSEWIGIGQGNSTSDLLAQTGIEDDACNDRTQTRIQLFWEVYPDNNQQFTPFGARPGDTIHVHVTVPKDCGDPVMTVQDLNTGGGGVYRYNQTDCSDGTAEWIYERTTEGSTLPMLANAPTAWSAQTVAGPNTPPSAVGNVMHYYDTMWNCTSAPDAELAFPGPLNSAGNGGELEWSGYGSVSPKGCAPWS